MGIEPTALCLGSRCSTTELRPLPANLAIAAYIGTLDLSIFCTKPATRSKAAGRDVTVRPGDCAVG